jgi:hypothetical protein
VVGKMTAGRGGFRLLSVFSINPAVAALRRGTWRADITSARAKSVETRVRENMLRRASDRKRIPCKGAIPVEKELMTTPLRKRCYINDSNFDLSVSGFLGCFLGSSWGLGFT